MSPESCKCEIPTCPEGLIRDEEGTCTKPCELNDTDFPKTDFKELFRWTADNDRSADCSDVKGTIQSKRTSCEEEYRCVKGLSDDPICPVKTGSYVKPKDGVFHEDIKIDGVDFELHYQSAYLDINTSLARGWTISTQARVQDDVLYLGNGTSYDVKDKVVYSIDGMTVSIGGYEYLFDANNRHIQIRSTYTKTPLYTFTYDVDDRLVSIADTYNQTSVLSYAVTGELQSITAPNGQVTQLSIGTNLNEVRYADNSYYAFTYDNHYLISKRDPNGNLYQYNYNANGQIISSTNPQNVTINFVQSSVTDGTDNVITSPLLNETKYKSFHLDANNMLRTEKILPTGEVIVYNNSVDELSSSVERCGVTTSNLYTAEDPVTKKRSLIATTQTMPSSLSKTTNIDTSYTYDASSNLATKTRTSTSNTKVTTSLTDYAKQEVSVTSPEGRVQTIKLDPLMRHVTQSVYADLTPTSYTYNDAGQLLQSTQGTRIKSNMYDASGNLITHTDESGNATHYSYDARNRLLSITNVQNQVTSFTYDANSNETRLTTPTPANFDSAFNNIDLKVSMTSPLGYTTNYTYDAEKHLTQMTRPSGKIITHSYLNGQHITTQTPESSYSYSYDCGDKISQIQKGTESIDYSYDGNLLTSMAYTGELNQVINYTYNNDFLADSIAYAGLTDTLNYDNDGMLIQSGSFNITRNSVNALPTTVSDTTFTQNRIFNTYGELDTETNTVNAKSVFSYEITERYADGKIKTKVETLDSTVTRYDYTYDSVNRLIQVKTNHKLSESYEYDVNGNRVRSLTVTKGGKGKDGTKGWTRTKIDTSYTIEDQIERVGAFTYTYDADGYLTSKTDGAETTTYDYGSLGELKQVTLPNSDIITYRHNANNQRVAKLKNGTVVEKYLWKDLTTLLAVYDGNNNLKIRFNYADNRVPYSMTKAGTTYYLAYDQVGSLKSVTDIAGNIIKELSYDSFGNILSDSNPSFDVSFRFAGGLYDGDTGLIRFGYRDYDPITGKSGLLRILLDLMAGIRVSMGMC